MDLLGYLRAELAPLMKRRDRLALRAIRDAIAAIENAETSYLVSDALVGEPHEFVAGAVRFGHAERVIRPLSNERMVELARAEVDRRLETAVDYRATGRIDEALTLKAEALALADRLAAFPG